MALPVALDLYFGDPLKLKSRLFGMTPTLTPPSSMADPTYQTLTRKVQQAKIRPDLPQYPLLVSQGDVPIHLVGTPQPASAYQPVPVVKTDHSAPATQAVVHLAEGPTLTAQGEVRDNVLHPFVHLGYTLTHHPIQFLEDLWDYTARGMGWVAFQYSDFFHQLQQWDGSWESFRHLTGLLWRGAIVVALTIGFVELAPLLQALGTWLRLVFDFIRGALGLVGSAVDELWYLLATIWEDVRYYLGL